MVCYGNVVGWMLLPQAVFDDYICQLDDDVLLPKIFKKICIQYIQKYFIKI